MSQTRTVQHSERLSRHGYSRHGRLRRLSRRSSSRDLVFTICLLCPHRLFSTTMIMIWDMLRLFCRHVKECKRLDERMSGEDSGSGRQGGPGCPVLVSGRVRSFLALSSCLDEAPAASTTLAEIGMAPHSRHSKERTSMTLIGFLTASCIIVVSFLHNATFVPQPNVSAVAFVLQHQPPTGKVGD